MGVNGADHFVAANQRVSPCRKSEFIVVGTQGKMRR